LGESRQSPGAGMIEDGKAQVEFPAGTWYLVRKDSEL